MKSGFPTIGSSVCEACVGGRRVGLRSAPGKWGNGEAMEEGKTNKQTNKQGMNE